MTLGEKYKKKKNSTAKKKSASPQNAMAGYTCKIYMYIIYFEL